ncbi:hypothetical protein WA026_018820 [Henosepilachna vigintioctopunctata]|uniref:RING-type domain-containing protein n=1 Tax=Henosepilachna vigintioctopunctata TaxID=420089 RepID=A0AAW1TY91_9CUCU
MNPERFWGQPARYNMRDREIGNYHAFNQQDPDYHQPQIDYDSTYDELVQLSGQRPDFLQTDGFNIYYGCFCCRFCATQLLNVPSSQGTPSQNRGLHSFDFREDDSELFRGNASFQGTGLLPLITGWQHNGPQVTAPDELHEFFTDSSDEDDISGGVFMENQSYEELLDLDERLENPRGLDKQKIESLGSFKFNVDRHQGNQTSCVVCMFEFEPSQLIRMLPCSHEFHAECIDKWFQTKTSCPICRKNVSDCTATSD